MYAELARYLAPGSDAITDPAYEMYHGLIPLAVAKQLSQPGQQSASLQGTCSQSFLEGQQAGLMQTAGLPRPEPPTNAKAKFLTFFCVYIEPGVCGAAQVYFVSWFLTGTPQSLMQIHLATDACLLSNLAYLGPLTKLLFAQLPSG